MLPLVSNDAVAILFMFDLTRKSTLNSIKEWYRQARGFNKVCLERDANTKTQGSHLTSPINSWNSADGDSRLDWHQV